MSMSDVVLLLQSMFSCTYLNILTVPIFYCVILGFKAFMPITLWCVWEPGERGCQVVVTAEHSQ